MSRAAIKPDAHVPVLWAFYPPEPDKLYQLYLMGQRNAQAWIDAQPGAAAAAPACAASALVVDDDDDGAAIPVDVSAAMPVDDAQAAARAQEMAWEEAPAEPPAAAGTDVLRRFQSPASAAAVSGQPQTTAGTLRTVDGGPAHVALVAKTVDVEAIRRCRPRVWLDAGHGAGSRVARPLLEHLGCEVVIEGGEPDGRFEHTPEPTADNLADMLPRIRLQHADIGFFQDPDADRLAIATAEGRYIGEEATLALAVEAVLAKRPGPIVVNCSTSGMAATIAERRGVACHVSAVGEANVVDAMLASNAILGGEGNGGVIDPRVVLVRDSFVAMALVLERMCTADAQGGRRDGSGITSIDSLAHALPQLVMKKTKVDLSPELQGPALATAIARIERAFPTARTSRLDGLRLDWDGGWLLVRASNTEPIVRIVAEAADANAVDEAVERATAALRS
jgi:phosphomannomutase